MEQRNLGWTAFRMVLYFLGLIRKGASYLLDRLAHMPGLGRITVWLVARLSQKFDRLITESRKLATEIEGQYAPILERFSPDSESVDENSVRSISRQSIADLRAQTMRAIQEVVENEAFIRAMICRGYMKIQHFLVSYVDTMVVLPFVLERIQSKYREGEIPDFDDMVKKTYSLTCPETQEQSRFVSSETCLYNLLLFFTRARGEARIDMFIYLLNRRHGIRVDQLSMMFRRGVVSIDALIRRINLYAMRD